jgi:hypothetical protein
MVDVPPARAVAGGDRRAQRIPPGAALSACCKNPLPLTSPSEDELGIRAHTRERGRRHRRPRTYVADCQPSARPTLSAAVAPDTGTCAACTLRP